MMRFRHLFILSVMTIFFISLGYPVFNSIDLDNNENFTELLSSHRSGLTLYYQFDLLNSFTVTTEEGEFTEIYIDQMAHTNVLGEPKLPMSRRFISVPLDAEVSVEATEYRVDNYRLRDYDIEYPIIPRQHPVPKCPDAEPQPFEYDAQYYSRDIFSDGPLVKAVEIGIMRGVRLFAVELYPVKYNPRAETLRIYNNIEIVVSFTGSDFVATEELRQRTFSPYFEFMYERQVMNYEPVAERENLTRYPVKYIIISDPMFENALQPFIEWKIRKGFEMIVGYTGSPEVGSTTATIKSFIQSHWNAATPEDPAPSFVLFVGDTAQIPAYSGNTGAHVTDLHYVRLEGTDYLPEMFYGRFSANNLAELQPQIDKTLLYEKLLMPDPSYLGESVLIAGVDSWWATSHGNGHINYATEHYFNAANGITAHTYLYPASGYSSQSIINDVSNGAGYVNYTAHGSATSWADPSFTISDVYGLQNQNKYSFVVGNCCITNKFEIYECFGEAWLRAPNAGGIGYIGGTNNTYWDEDFWWGVGYVASIPSTGNALPYNQTGPGMFDGLFHTHNEDFIDWYTTGGAMIYAGNMGVEQSNSPRKNMYWEIYALMGDPSLTPYMREPLENIANYPQQIFLGQSQIQITAEPYSYVALSMDNEIYGVALIDASGQATIDIAPFDTPGTANLVITLQNHEPVITEIEVLPNVGPYVIMAGYELDVAGNVVAIPQYGDMIDIHVTLQNVGVEEAFNVSAQLSTEDTYITIVDNYEFIGDLNPDESVYIQNAFQLSVADDVPDQHQSFFTLEVSSAADDTWTTNFYFTIASPSFDVLTPIVDDSTPGGNDDGILDPGETADIFFPVINEGHALSPETAIRFISGSPFLTLISDQYSYLGTIESGATEYAQFTVVIDPDVPVGSSATVGINVFSGGYFVQETIILPVGLLIEDFSSGDFDSYPWSFSGNQPWMIDHNQSYEGSYSARSGVITHNQSSSMSVSMDVPVAGDISFYLKVSSEANYDYLKFFINNQQQGQWSGTVDWTHVSYPVQSGTNTFRWTYSKDFSVSHGSDCAWIDYIIFPSSGIETSGPIFSVYPETIDFGEVPVGHVFPEEFTISNFGDEPLSGVVTTYDGFTIEYSTVRSLRDGIVFANDPDRNVERNLQNRTSGLSSVRNADSRNEYNYNIPAESYQVFILLFEPEEIQDYSGQIAITSNDPNNQLAHIDIIATGIMCLLPPSNLQASVDNNTVYLTWYPPILNTVGGRSLENTRVEFYGYNVYRDGVLLNDNPVTAESYQDPIQASDMYSYYVTAVYDLGESLPSNTVDVEVILSSEDDLLPPYVTDLKQNYPNPFNPVTTIEFSIRESQPVKIEIFNIAGQLVEVLVEENLPAGDHRIVWNSSERNRGQITSGIYLYRMTTREYVETKKMILLK